MCGQSGLFCKELVMQQETTYWFPAKQYGWGWGAPATWQGWVVLAIFVGLAVAGSLLLLPGYGQVVFFAYIAVLSLVLLAICWIKGEPPAWRWGDK
jgi:hypothetical protein